MSNPTTAQSLPVLTDPRNAPFIYFDVAPAFGVFNGVVQLELAARTLMATPDGGVTVEFQTCGHLRCSPETAKFLRDGIDGALKMLAEPPTGQTPPPTVAAGKLN